MKRFLLMLCLVVCSAVIVAQDGANKVVSDSTSASRGVFYKEVSKRLNIKDKVFLVNRTPYLILQSVVAMVDDKDGHLTSLGACSLVSPGASVELLSLSDGALKYLRGKRLAIKVKASKKMIATNHTSVNTPMGSADVQYQNVDPEVINSLQPEDMIYNFDAVLYEANHDLYIRIFYKGENGIMDF